MTGERSTLVGGDKLRAVLRAVGVAGARALGVALYREAERIMARSKTEFVPSDMGILRASGFVKPAEVSATSVSVTLGYGGAARAYALYVHEGTGPAVGRPAFFPPLEAIRAWAKRHGLPEAAAFPIARAIGRRGLRPLKYLERPVLEAVPGMDGRLAAVVRREVARATR